MANKLRHCVAQCDSQVGAAAARVCVCVQELKRQSWRYHKQHNAWFQRYAEPTVTNEEYEQVGWPLQECTLGLRFSLLTTVMSCLC
jgi:hypothetical protein